MGVEIGVTEIILALIVTLGGGGSVLTAVLRHRAGNREFRQATQDKLWGRLVTERERAERERDRAESELELVERSLYGERLYVHVLLTAMMAAGLTVPRRPVTD
jgi:hypothetical protein